jgi:hypothetical protein
MTHGEIWQERIPEGQDKLDAKTACSVHSQSSWAGVPGVEGTREREIEVHVGRGHIVEDVWAFALLLG